jgi:pyruvate kinase
MRSICSEAEAYVEQGQQPGFGARSPRLEAMIDPLTEASVDAARLFAERLQARLIVVSTDSGRTALALSSRRPAATILAFARSEQTARALALCWGVTPLVHAEIGSAESELNFALDWARSQSLVKSGQQVVLLRGQFADRPKSQAIVAGEVT